MGFDIQVIANEDKSRARVSAIGSAARVITDKDMKAFKLDSDILKDAVKAKLGARPDDVFVRMPAVRGDGDLYKMFGWPEVQMILKPLSATVLSVTKEKESVGTATVRNTYEDRSINAHVIVNTELSDSISNEWSRGSSITAGAEFTVKAECPGVGGVEAKASLEATESWGSTKGASRAYGVSMEAGADVELQPGESLEGQLYADHETLKARIRYRAYLTGAVAVNYPKGYKGHHFYAFNIGSLMKEVKKPNSIVADEVVSVGFWANLNITAGPGTRALLRELDYFTGD